MTGVMSSVQAGLQVRTDDVAAKGIREGAFAAISASTFSGHFTNYIDGNLRAEDEISYTHTLQSSGHLI